jgi:hypothetical protein
MNRTNNIYKLLEFPQDPTDYEDFEDVAPYNKLENGKWSSLRLIHNRHPLYYIIKDRFNGNYDGKLLWKELNIMKKRIEKRREALRKYLESVGDRLWELRKKIRESKELCSEGATEYISKIDTIFLSILSTKVDEKAPLADFGHQVDDMAIMSDIISFIEPKETCAQKLQKHLNKCMGYDGTGRFKCTKDFNGCEEVDDDGRCDHYYEIQSLKEDLNDIEGYEYEENMKIAESEYKYKKALAVKEDRLRQFYEYDDY